MISRADLFAHLDNLAAADRPPICWTTTGIDFTAEHPVKQREAAHWCQRCPARAPCGDFGLGAGIEEQGTYGGLSTADRQRTIPTTIRKPS